MIDADGALAACLVSAVFGAWVGAGLRSTRLLGRVQRLQAIGDRQSREIEERSQELCEVQMKIHSMESRVRQAERLAGFWRAPHEPLPLDSHVVVLRDAGQVGNPAHPGARSGRWMELTTTAGRSFSCDFLSTGWVIGWVPAEEFLGVPLPPEGVAYV